MDEQGADVVELFPGMSEVERDAPVRTREREHHSCSHRRTELDQEARRVYCRDCGREVPAFKVLTQLAREFERWVEAWKAAKSEAKRVQANLEELKREERNVKARIRNARRRVDV